MVPFKEGGNTIFSKFLNLNPEKQARILNAAMKEFAQKGYKDASTNEIVKEAGISKGVLFHYFKNKKQLYLFLYDYCLELLMNEFYEKLDIKEKDFFVRLRQMQMIKFDIVNRHPEMFTFLQVAYLEDAPEVSQDLVHRNEKMIESGAGKAFEGIDISKFREDVDVGKAIKTVLWTFEGFAKEEMAKAKLRHENLLDYEKLFAEAELYLRMFTNCFYK